MSQFYVIFLLILAFLNIGCDESYFRKLNFNELSESKIRIFYAKDCSSCAFLKDQLYLWGYKKYFPVVIESEALYLPIEYIDISDPKHSIINESRMTTEVPEIQFVSKLGPVLIPLKLLQSQETINEFISQISADEIFEKKLAYLKDNPPLPFKRFASPQKSSALIIGTGRTSDENPIYVGYSIKNIQNILTKNMGLPKASIITLYGTNPEVPDQPIHKEAVRDGVWKKYTFVPGVSRTAPFTRESLFRASHSLLKSDIQKLLVVLVGHGSPYGIAERHPQRSALNAEELVSHTLPIIKHTVTVGGTCFGGQMASTPYVTQENPISQNSIHCGFFAANPEMTSYGCQTDDQNAKNPKDYLSGFFNAIRHKNADFNGDGKLSWNEVHLKATEAVLISNPQQSPYTSLDRYIYENNIFPLNMSLSPSQLRETIAWAEPKEAEIILKLLDAMFPKKSIRPYLLPLANSFELKFTTADGDNTFLLNISPFNEAGRFINMELRGSLANTIQDFLIQEHLTPDNGYDILKVEPWIKDNQLSIKFTMIKTETPFLISTRAQVVVSPEQYPQMPTMDLTPEIQELQHDVEAWYGVTERDSFRPALIQLLARVWGRHTLKTNRALDPLITEGYKIIESCENQDVYEFLK